MSRGSFWFLAFLVVLGVALAVIAAMLGPSLLRFLFHDARDTAPFVAVNLLDPADESAPVALLEIMTERLGGEPLWLASTDRVYDGATPDDWPVIALITHSSRAQFVDRLTTEGLSTLTGLPDARLERSAVLAATPLHEFRSGDAEAFALRLIALTDADGLSAYAERWRNEEVEKLAEHGGVVVWQATLNPLRTDARHAFSYVVLFGFPDRSRLHAWLDDPARATMTSLQQRWFQRDVMLTLTPLALPAGDTSAVVADPP